MERTVWMYWTGKKPDLIQKLANKVNKNSNNGKNYILRYLNDTTIKDYIDIPEWFYRLKAAHKADYVRVKLLRKYGGIWLDADTVVLNNMNKLFSYLEGDKKGFFIIENDFNLCNGVFGSKANTELMKEWERHIDDILKKKLELYKNTANELPLNWTEIGSSIMTEIGKKNIELYKDYKIINGLKQYYRIPYRNPELFFKDLKDDLKIKKIYDDIIKNDDIVILVNLVYRIWEVLKTKEFLNETLIGKLISYDSN